VENRWVASVDTGAYDVETNTTFWTTGNPSPSNRGEGRAGDNLYSNSLLALDPDTGKLNGIFSLRSTMSMTTTRRKCR